MPLSYMEHFLLQTEDIEATKDWYVKILGFRVGPSPDFKFPVYWLYLGDRDVLHITTGGKNVSENRKKYVGQQSEASAGTGLARMNREFAGFYPATLTSDPELAAAFAEGQQLTLEQATELALMRDASRS